MSVIYDLKKNEDIARVVKTYFNKRSFDGSLARPYNLRSYRERRRPLNPLQIINRMTSLNSFINNGGKSNVKDGDFFVTLISDKVSACELDNDACSYDDDSVLVAVFDSNGNGMLCQEFSALRLDVSVCVEEEENLEHGVTPKPTLKLRDVIISDSKGNESGNYSAFVAASYSRTKFNFTHNNRYNFYFINNILLINADQGSGAYCRAFDNAVELNLSSKFKNCVPISFSCLSLLISGGTSPHLVNAINFKIEQVIDYIEDSRIAVSPDFVSKHCKNFSRLTAENRRKFEKTHQPDKGYSLIKSGSDWVWHRSGSVLLSYYDKNDNKQYALFGQDDGSYFGCILPESAKSINEAYTLLKPADIRKLPASSVLRQGEWFATPISYRNLPSFMDRFYVNKPDTFDENKTVGTCANLCVLPKESNRSNDHNIVCRINSDNHNVDGLEAFAATNGRFYVRIPTGVKIIVEHDEHPELEIVGQSTDYTNGWVMFSRNTAIASYSSSGVD